MLHRFQPADHRFHPGSYLLILVKERRALGGQRLVSLAQRAVLFLQVLYGGDELFDPFPQSHQLEIELRFCCVGHVYGTIERCSRWGQ